MLSHRSKNSRIPSIRDTTTIASSSTFTSERGRKPSAARPGFTLKVALVGEHLPRPVYTPLRRSAPVATPRTMPIGVLLTRTFLRSAPIDPATWTPNLELRGPGSAASCVASRFAAALGHVFQKDPHVNCRDPPPPSVAGLACTRVTLGAQRSGIEARPRH